MEPLVKRLRRHESLELDEENPDFQTQREKGQTQLKDAWEKIFAKYENFPEDMDDEIEWDTTGDGIGHIVVDRGHVRQLPDDRDGGAVMQMIEELVDHGPEEQATNLDEDSEDELSASIPIRVHKPKQVIQKEQQQGEQSLQLEPIAIPTATAPTNPIPQLFNSALLGSALSPPDPTHIVHSPQVPENQPAHANFLEGLNKAISEAVNQYTSQALQSYYSALPCPVPTTTPLVSAPIATPVAASAKTPGTDPKWWFPSLSTLIPQSILAQSSPIPAPSGERVRRKGFSRRSIGSTATPNVANPSSPAVSGLQATGGTDRAPCEKDETETTMTQTFDTSEKIDVISTVGTNTDSAPWQRFCFSSEDDYYILQQKEDRKLTWAQIQEGRPTLAELPVWYLSQYYQTIRTRKPVKPIKPVRTRAERKRNRNTGKSAEAEVHETNIVSQKAKPAEMDHSEKRDSVQRQLLTPSSIQNAENKPSVTKEHIRDPSEDIDQSLVEKDGMAEENSRHVSQEEEDSMQVDQEEEDMELLSLVNSPEPEEIEIPDLIVDPEELILASIEIHEEYTVGKSEPQSPTTTVDAEYQIISEMGMQEILLPKSPFLKAPSPFEESAVDVSKSSPIRLYACEDCTKPFKTSRTLKWHQDTECQNRHSKTQPSIPGSSFTPACLPIEPQDELTVPITPRIKRESATPEPNFLFSTPVAHIHTPMSAPQLKPCLNSSVRKSGPVARAIQNMKVRQEWAKSVRRKSGGGGRVGQTPQPVNMRKRKLVVADLEGESEDELAM
ncbi:hypothetical protein B0J11DRAFT_324065 [Dendryphion nanum]|uniref:C2H2-type domain-containing protein n=1 Tax=Dendryphion nanum TaxID=256645 RepID=A0A9P9IKN8_9PLEO|nr:hypothetical protein B0J11DRAFT_324065 [Dendryphion nanum]